MTPAQTAKYFWEWGRAREYYLRKGMSQGEADRQRHVLHAKALGRDKSSKLFTNSDLDKVIAVFRAVWDDANFDAQMRQQDQPDRRAAAVLAQIYAILPYIGVNAGLETRYLGGICKRLFGTHSIYHISDAQLYKLFGVLCARVKKLFPADRAAEIVAKARAAKPVSDTVPAAPHAARDEDDGEPF